jgi:signal transduction histidine kinase
VTGTAPVDRKFEARLHEVVPRFEDRATAEFLAGLPNDAVMTRLGELGPESVVFTTGYFQDGDGRYFVPREAVRAMVVAANAPVYGPFDTFIGTGIVGGYMSTFSAIGREAGRAVKEILAGTAPASLRLPEVMPATLNLDWGQARRWGIDEDAIPGDAVVHFKQPPFLEEHRNEAIAATSVFLFQGGLIGWLLVERHRRRLAELAVQKQRFELTHASRLAVAGELTASIAHDINQPLGAILSNADAADLILESGGGQREELRAILADIRRDDLRAGAVIQRLRALLAKKAVQRRPFDLIEAVIDAAAVLRAEARRRRMTLEVRSETTAAPMVGDRVQIQQVVINLVLNAMDAMADMPEDRRAVVVSIERLAGNIAMTVRDQGNGIVSEHLPQLFDSFFSTKRTGMGLGLSIARSVCEAHGGRIWAENAPGQGAVFHVECPAATGAGTPSGESA